MVRGRSLSRSACLARSRACLSLMFMLASQSSFTAAASLGKCPRFLRVGSVDHLACGRCEVQERDEPVPCLLPSLDGGRILLAPGRVRKHRPGRQCRVRVGGGVDRLQCCGDLFCGPGRPRTVSRDGSVHHTCLDRGMGPGCGDRLRQELVRPSQHTMSTSRTPRLARFAQTLAQNFASSVAWTQIPSMCLIPSMSTPTVMWAERLAIWVPLRTFTMSASK